MCTSVNIYKHMCNSVFIIIDVRIHTRVHIPSLPSQPRAGRAVCTGRGNVWDREKEGSGIVPLPSPQPGQSLQARGRMEWGAKGPYSPDYTVGSPDP